MYICIWWLIRYAWLINSTNNQMYNKCNMYTHKEADLILHARVHIAGPVGFGTIYTCTTCLYIHIHFCIHIYTHMVALTLLKCQLRSLLRSMSHDYYLCKIGNNFLDFFWFIYIWIAVLRQQFHKIWLILQAYKGFQQVNPNTYMNRRTQSQEMVQSIKCYSDINNHKSL